MRPIFVAQPVLQLKDSEDKGEGKRDENNGLCVHIKSYRLFLTSVVVSSMHCQAGLVVRMARR